MRVHYEFGKEGTVAVIEFENFPKGETYSLDGLSKYPPHHGQSTVARNNGKSDVQLLWQSSEFVFHVIFLYKKMRTVWKA